ncbi:MAG: diguanylate cyclase [Rhodospirillales bacterium]|nr:diguanylate cyclase [Rhodospirillales bacterium]
MSDTGVYGQSLEQAAEYASSAVKAMADLGIPAHPGNFVIWYNYFAGTFPDLKKTIDILIGNKQDFTPSRCEEIHDKFFGFGGEGAIVDEATRRVEAELRQVIAYIEDADKGALAYGKELENASGGLASTPAVDDVKALIADVINATETMREKNSALERRLNESSSEVKKLQSDLENMRQEALTDALTGIANRKKFDMELRRAALEAMESGSELCLMLLDIDHFKKFNDTHGHQTGDQVLRLVGSILNDMVKGQDTPARYGGEEFAIILPRTPMMAAAKLADSIRERIGNKALVNRKTGIKLGRVTLSVGVGRFDWGEPLTQLVSRADQALYMAKGQGRNRVITQEHIEQSELALGG